MQQNIEFPVYWKTKDNKNILIKDLDDNHLMNILKMIRKKNRLLAIYSDREKNLEQLELILLHKQYKVCPITSHLYEWIESKMEEYDEHDESFDYYYHQNGGIL